MTKAENDTDYGVEYQRLVSIHEFTNKQQFEDWWINVKPQCSVGLREWLPCSFADKSKETFLAECAPSFIGENLPPAQPVRHDPVMGEDRFTVRWMAEDMSIMECSNLTRSMATAIIDHLLHTDCGSTICLRPCEINTADAAKVENEDAVIVNFELDYDGGTLEDFDEAYAKAFIFGEGRKVIANPALGAEISDSANPQVF